MHLFALNGQNLMSQSEKLGEHNCFRLIYFILLKYKYKRICWWMPGSGSCGADAILVEVRGLGGE